MDGSEPSDNWAWTSQHLQKGNGLAQFIIMYGSAEEVQPEPLCLKWTLQGCLMGSVSGAAGVSESPVGSAWGHPSRGCHGFTFKLESLP